MGGSRGRGRFHPYHQHGKENFRKQNFPKKKSDTRSALRVAKNTLPVVPHILPGMPVVAALLEQNKFSYTLANSKTVQQLRMNIKLGLKRIYRIFGYSFAR